MEYGGQAVDIFSEFGQQTQIVVILGVGRPRVQPPAEVSRKSLD